MIDKRLSNVLQECIDNNWDLDVDDIKHILDQDFQYVRDNNTIVKTYENADEMTKELTEEMAKELSKK